MTHSGEGEGGEEEKKDMQRERSRTGKSRQGEPVVGFLFLCPALICKISFTRHQMRILGETCPLDESV